MFSSNVKMTIIVFQMKLSNFSLGTNVTCLKFVMREASDTLVVTANSGNGGFVDIWELGEKPQPVHKLFQPKTIEPYKTVVWNNKDK